MAWRSEGSVPLTEEPGHPLVVPATGNTSVSAHSPLPYLEGLAQNDSTQLLWSFEQMYLKDFMHPHWHGFPPPSPVQFRFIGFYLIIVGVVGFIGNSLLFASLATSRRLRTPANVPLMALTLTDGLMSGISFPFPVIACIKGSWYFGHTGCIFYGFSMTALGICSICLMVVIAAERWLVIRYTFLVQRHVTYFSMTVITVIAILYGTIWCLPPLFKWNRYVLEGVGISCSVDFFSQDQASRQYVLCLFIGGFTIPLLLITFFYTHIIHTIYTHRQAMQRCMDSSHGQSVVSRETEIRVTKVALTVVALFCVAWIPYAVVSMIGSFGPQEILTPMATSIPALFAKSSAIYNPIIYGLGHREFQRVIKRCIQCLWCWKKSDIRRTRRKSPSLHLSGVKTYTSSKQNRRLQNNRFQTTSLI